MNRQQWEVFGTSIRGATHIRSGQSCQDAISLSEPNETSPFAILAVADGHGSAKSFRSDIGATFAVKSAVTELKRFLAEQGDLSDLSRVKQMAKDALPKDLVKKWAAEIRQDLDAKPLTAAEIDNLEQKDGKCARERVEENPLVAYGSTILALAIGEGFALYLQLGDGDIVCVSEQGEPSRPMPVDDRLFANETTSLCLPKAWRDFRVQLEVFSSNRPALIMVSTDGYANSYRDDAGFLKVAPDILAMIRSAGTETVRAELGGWLAETSAEGSGDDITLGLIVRRL